MQEEGLEPPKLHPDSAYVMQDHIGLVIAKGLSVVYKERPSNAVDYFAKWLLHESSVRKKQNQERAHELEVQELRRRQEQEV